MTENGSWAGLSFHSNCWYRHRVTKPPNSFLRTLLVLGRVSNLPTVWTNCLAGWMLGGGGSPRPLWFLIPGASRLYVGGMYLNDAFDARHDRQRRAERPIPLGNIRESTVWGLGFIQMLIGWALLVMLGFLPALLSSVLVGTILWYDAVHKRVSWSPVIMASCRVLLFLTAAATGSDGVTGLALWSAIVLGGWIVGLSFVARRESAENPSIPGWPFLFLALPAFLGYLANEGAWRRNAWILIALVAAWAIRCIRFSRIHPPQIGKTVGGLIAGVCLVDWLAVNPGPFDGLWFAASFGLALLAQRLVPST